MPNSTPQTMALAGVPRILELLVRQQTISEAQKDAVLQAIKGTDSVPGEKGFAGEIAVRHGYLSEEQLAQALAVQTHLKIEAALNDLERMQKGEALAAPDWLHANCGNNEVNPQSKLAGAGSAAIANLVQNLAMLVHEDRIAPKISAPDQLRASEHPDVTFAIAAGKRLNAALYPHGETPPQPMRAPDEAIHAISHGIRTASSATRHLFVDSAGRNISLETYLHAREREASREMKAQAAPEDWQSRTGRPSTPREPGV